MKKNKPESEPPTPPPIGDTPKPRNYRKSVFVIQEATPVGPDEPAGWSDLIAGPLESSADCRAYIKAAGLAGTFRVIIVRDRFTSKATTVTKILFE